MVHHIVLYWTLNGKEYLRLDTSAYLVNGLIWLPSLVVNYVHRVSLPSNAVAILLYWTISIPCTHLSVPSPLHGWCLLCDLDGGCDMTLKWLSSEPDNRVRMAATKSLVQTPSHKPRTAQLDGSESKAQRLSADFMKIFTTGNMAWTSDTPGWPRWMVTDLIPEEIWWWQFMGPNTQLRNGFGAPFSVHGGMAQKLGQGTFWQPLGKHLDDRDRLL